jgi:hypothetical protein
MIGISATLVPRDPTLPVSVTNPMVDISQQLPSSQWKQNLARVTAPAVPSNVKPQPVITTTAKVVSAPAPIITKPIPTPTILAPISTQALATQAPPAVSMQALNQDQVAMAKSMGYATPDNMSSGQLARVNAALADAASRTQTQQAGTSGGSSVNVGTSVSASSSSSSLTWDQVKAILFPGFVPGSPGGPPIAGGNPNPSQVQGTDTSTSTNANQQSTGNTTAGGATSTDTTNAAFSLSDFISQNSTFLLIAAVLVAGYVMLGEEEPRRGRH